MVRPPKKIETEKILATIAEMRALIPEQYKPKPKARPPEETRMTTRSTGDAESAFELGVVVDAISAFSEELNETIEAIDAKLLRDCLNVYYTMEEMVKDPQHAELLPHLEATQGVLRLVREADPAEAEEGVGVVFLDGAPIANLKFSSNERSVVCVDGLLRPWVSSASWSSGLFS